MEFAGLSLCIQGTLIQQHTKLKKFRFIPVYTGNTGLIESPITRNAVYPCVYREHKIDTYVADDKIGLSLCIQGTPEN